MITRVDGIELEQLLNKLTESERATVLPLLLKANDFEPFSEHWQVAILDFKAKLIELRPDLDEPRRVVRECLSPIKAVFQ